MTAALRRFLADVYEAHNHRSLVGDDPLRFVLESSGPDEREVVGLLAASLAFGRVAQIARSLEALLGLLGAPCLRVDTSTRAADAELLRGFRHRFVTGEDVADLLEGMRTIRRRWGSLRSFFVAGCYEPSLRSGGDVCAALSAFVGALGSARATPNYLLPDPARGSACKRLHLYLRWMVRRDDVDPGPWEGVRPADLMIPMDTHMHRICGLLGFTDRRQADALAAREATEAFRVACPEDPVRFDFGLTRLGMEGRLDEIPRG